MPSLLPITKGRGFFLKDPWAARDDYIEVVIDRSLPSPSTSSGQALEQFLVRHAARPLEHDELVTLLKLLELQRQAMLMYTSCGWFFDDLTGIETVQILKYAGRAVQLAKEIPLSLPSAKGEGGNFDTAIDSRFLELLNQAKGNVPEYGDGRRIYEQLVEPARVDWERMGAHYAVRSLFEEYGQEAKINCYTVELEDYRAFAAGRAKLAMGRAKFTSEITRESMVLSFGALHFGDHNVDAGAQVYHGEEPYLNMVQQTSEAFGRADFPEVARALARHLGGSSYSLSSLLPDERRQVLERVLASTLAEAEAEYRQVYQRHYPLMRFLAGIGDPIPSTFRVATKLTLSADLRKAVSEHTLDVERIMSLLDEAKIWDIDLDTEGAARPLQQTVAKLTAGLRSAPRDLSFLDTLVAAVSIARSMSFEVNLWEVQNLYHQMLQATYPQFQQKAQQGDKTAQEWVTSFTSLGKLLSMRLS